MKNIPADGIYYDDALVIVAEMITPNWQKIVEEQLNPAPAHDDAFPERNDKARARDDVERAYHKALDLAHERLTEKRSQGILVAWVRNLITGQVDQLHRDANIDRYAPECNGQPYFFDPESFDNAVKEIAQPTTGRVENPEPTRPAERELLDPKARPTPTAASKKTHPQPERAARHIARLYPDGTDAISSEVIRKKLEKDPVLLAELAAQGGKSPSRASIDRALGRRK